MADRYWVGGTGTWDNSNTANWSATSGGSSGASVPAIGDDVYFNSASNATGYTVTASGAIQCKNFSLSGPASGSVTFGGSGNLNVYDDFTIAATGVTWSKSGSLNFYYFSSPSTITTNGVTLFNTSVVFNDSSGSWTLGSAFSCGGDISIFNGTLSTSASNYSLTTGFNGYLFPGGGTLNFNASTVTVGYIYTLGASGAINSGTSTLVIQKSDEQKVPSYTWYNVILQSTSQTFTRNIFSGATVSNTLTIWGPNSDGYTNVTLNSGSVIGAIATNNTTPVRRLLFSGATSLTTTGSSVTDADFASCTISTNTLTGTRLGNRLNNSGITFSTPKTVYWNLAGSQVWSATGWATSSGGSPNVNNFPLPQDTAVIDNAGSITSLQIVLNWALPSIDFSTRTSAVAFVINTFSPFAYGNITLGSGVTVSGSANIYFRNSSTKTITPAGKSFTQAFIFEEGSTQLGGALTTSGSITLTGGTFNTAGYAVGSLSFSSNFLNPRTLTLGNSTWTVSASSTSAWQVPYDANLTLSAASATISMSGSFAKTFTGGNYTWGALNQGGAGALTVVANGATFGNITNTTQPATITFTAANTIYFNAFSLSGTSGSLITINSTSAGSAATLSKVGGGTVSCDFLSIRDSTATGSGATWYAGGNSTNVSNNTGWLFYPAPGGSGLLFFFN